jgi:hypothetical protein
MAFHAGGRDARGPSKELAAIDHEAAAPADVQSPFEMLIVAR